MPNVEVDFLLWRRVQERSECHSCHIAIKLKFDGSMNNKAEVDFSAWQEGVSDLASHVAKTMSMAKFCLEAHLECSRNS